MRLRHALLLAAAATAVGTSSADAAWSPPTQLGPAEEANQEAYGFGGGTIVTGWLEPRVSTSTRGADDTFGAPTPRTTADPFERIWETGLDGEGRLTALSVRKHKPTQCIRAVVVGPDGVQQRSFVVSDRSHSAARPELDVAPDGTAVAAWQWHDTAGWRVQVAIRRPGQTRFDKPQTLSPPAEGTARPWIHVAAGVGGRAALSWQIGGSYELPEAPLHVLTAGDDSRFGAAQALPDAGGLADAELAVGPAGEVQVAYLDQHFSGNEGPSSLRVAQGTAGAPLAGPVVLSTGGKGTTSGTQVAAAFAPDGSATVAWGRPGTTYEAGGTLEVFTRPAGASAFGPVQALAEKVEGIDLAVGGDGRAVLAWMTNTSKARSVDWSVFATTRPSGGAPFGAPTVVSATETHALWPSVAITDRGEALATWVTNTNGGGSGQVTAAIDG